MLKDIISAEKIGWRYDSQSKNPSLINLGFISDRYICFRFNKQGQLKIASPGAGQGRPASGEKTRFNSVVFVKTGKPYAARRCDAVMVGMQRFILRGGLERAFRQRPARWRSSGAPKTLAFLRAAEFGWARVSERWPQPRRAFCLYIEAQILMCISVFDVSHFFHNGKKRDERVCGRNPRSDRRERRSAYAPVVRWPPRARCTKQFSFDFIQQPRRHDLNK